MSAEICRRWERRTVSLARAVTTGPSVVLVQGERELEPMAVMDLDPMQRGEG